MTLYSILQFILRTSCTGNSEMQVSYIELNLLQFTIKKKQYKADIVALI